jgi:cob(I)alamin adenosyltransferase
MKGYVQIYTGDGKGKTTAALGLALRAAGAGKKVFMAQFIKSGEYSEIKALERFSDLITVKQYGLGRFIKNSPSEKDRAMVQKGISEIKAVMASGDAAVIILDEINVALKLGLVKLKTLLHLMDLRPGHVELVLTGRGADPAILERADLITEMTCVRHYFAKNVPARKGIEK